MVVLPEDALYGDTFRTKGELFPYLDVLPQPDSSAVLCPADGSSPLANESAFAFPTLRAVACLALAHNITVVYGGGDRQPCSPSTDPSCPPPISVPLPDGSNSSTPEQYYSFNTQIAVHANGTLASKYHKTHLFINGDAQYDPNPRPAPVSFLSDFGVRFGQMVCFDVLFRSPATESWPVGHVLLSSFW